MVFYSGDQRMRAVHTKPLIDVYATIEGSKSVFDEFSSDAWNNVYHRSSVDAMKRIESLGLKHINETLGRDVAHYPSDTQVESAFKSIEDTLWKTASNVKTRRFSYKDKDFMNAINFLELIGIYSAQKLAMENKSDIFENEGFTVIEKSAFKAIKELEFLAKHMKSDKFVIRQHVARATRLLNKIYTNNLSHMEQAATGKIFHKAIRVLERMGK